MGYESDTRLIRKVAADVSGAVYLALFKTNVRAG